MSLNHKQQSNVKNNVFSTKKLSLTASVLPLIFQSGRTILFSLNLIKRLPRSDLTIQVRSQTMHVLIIFMHYGLKSN